MATPETKTELLKSHMAELTKTHVALDAQSRPEYYYVAVADAAHGSACICTRMSYSGLTSIVVYAKEYYASWDSSWDVF